MKEIIKFMRGAKECYDEAIDTDDISVALQRGADALQSYQWRQIETAPKDGTDIMVYFELPDLSKDWMRSVFVYWSKREERWNYSGRAASGYSKCYEPTHWKPLPPPPEGV